MTRSRAQSSQVAALVFAFIAVTAMIFQTTSAVFSDTTTNPDNSWAAGTVVITDDDAGAAMFSATNIAPGYTDDHCITVTYEGTVAPANVRLYAAQAGVLAEELDVTVEYEDASAASFGSDCTGFAADGVAFTGMLNTLGADFAAGSDNWAPNTNDARTYRFSVELPTTAPPSASGTTADVDFIWEAQS